MNNELAIECLVATSGLYPSEPIDDGYVRRAQKIPKETAAEIRAFYDLEKPTRPEKAPKISYLGTWKRLNQQQDDKSKAVLISDPEAHDAYVAKLAEVRAYLRDNWRPSTITTILGPKLLSPSTSEEARCQDLFAMGNDVQRIVRRLTACCIMADEIALVRAVFPEFYAMIGAFIDSEMLRRRADRKRYEVPYMQEVAIRAFVGDSSGAEVETINSDTAPPEQEAPPEFDIQTEKRRTAMTRADRLEEGNASE